MVDRLRSIARRLGARSAVVIACASMLVMGACTHVVKRSVDHLATHREEDVEVVTVEGTAHDFEVAYVVADSLVGYPTRGGEPVHVPLKEVDGVYVDAIHWSRVVVVGVAAAFAFIFLRVPRS